MQVGDILRVPSGNHFRVIEINEDDEVITRHMEFNLTLPPIRRSLLEAQTVNMSAHCWDKRVTDLEVELAMGELNHA